MSDGEGRPSVQIEVPIAWGEQDAFGHLNNVAYFRYLESVRMHFLERTGILQLHRSEGIGVILANATCDFLQPVHWPQYLVVIATCSAIGTTSLTLAYSITDELGLICAKGTSVQVMYDYRRNGKVPIPAAIRQALELGSRS